jgi:hypothetical protein
LRGHANRIGGLFGGGVPVRFGFGEGVREGAGVYPRKTSMAIIEKNGDGLFEPAGGYDEVGGVITVHVARGDLKAASGRNDENSLLSGGAEL